jgi:hypothetical protein
MDQAWKEALKRYLEEMNRAMVDGKVDRERLKERGFKPLAVKTTAIPLYSATFGDERADGEVETALALHQQVYYMQGDRAYLQENRRVQHVRMRREGDDWAFLWPWGWYFEQHHLQDLPLYLEDDMEETDDIQEVTYSGGYNRALAVAYAERYWNTYNPAYIRFEVDCTSFVSQCLHAGGIPMIGFGNRSKGWWYRGGSKPSWSFSWSVAHSLYLLLKSGKAPMYALTVDHPSYLQPGDVICYDFDGDGRWQHNTIVVAKDGNNMPLVNAHTYDSRMRYWEYRDSTAYTPRIRYGFFRIAARKP